MGNKNSAKKKQNKSVKQSKTNNNSNDIKEQKSELDYNAKDFEWETDGTVLTKLDFDTWYPIVNKFTPKSELTQVNSDQIKAIIDGCDICRIDRTRLDENLKDTSKDILGELTKYIDGFIADNELKDDGIFIRFSNRSPKDAILKINKDEFEGYVDQVATELVNNNENNEWSKDEIVCNSIIRAMTIASSEKLCIKSGELGMELILNSMRIYQDFKLGELRFGDEYKTQLILREFNHNIDFECEFRCFIFKDNITAITQYNSMICIERIVNNKDNILNSIKKYWNDNIKDLMNENNITSYVLDVGLMKNNDDIILIEMNPFCTKAGALLFDWKKDIKTMLSTPIEFRIATKPCNKKPKKLTSELNALFDKLYAKLIK